MEFRLLGPFEARDAHRPIEAGSRRQERCLLAILLLDAGRVVPVARIIDLLWDGSAPESARGTVHTYVGRLRGALDPHGVRIVTQGDGYLVEADGHWVDVHDFARMANEAVGVREPGERVRLLDRALAMWRGPLLADLADEPLRERLGVHLEQLREASIELRAEAQLTLGLQDRVVADLAPLVSQRPTRERLVAHLMTALYRCGRQADALGLFRVTRQALVDDLGIEPGPDLQVLHQRILRNDQGLTRPEIPKYVISVRGESLPWNIAGHPALEFCNTFAGWGRQPPLPRSEWLRSYVTLAAWADYMDLVDDRTTTFLIDEAQRHPAEANSALDEARALRGHLYTCVTDPGDHRSFQAVARFAEAAAKVSVFDRDPDGMGRWSMPRSAGLKVPVYAAARAAADLLADPRRLTVRVCPSPDCGWLFLDKAGMRKWCSMATCGKAETCGEAQRLTG